MIGLGGLGSAAAYWLARRGVDVIGFEQFELGHVRGASHDHSRIIRRSYHTPGYVELTAHAYDAWADVERESGESIITRTGGVDLFPEGGTIDPSSYTSSLDAVGVPYEWIDGVEVRRRWPAFADGDLVDDSVMAIYSPETGIVPAGRGTAILQRLAHERGAELRPNTAVRSIRPVGGEVDVVTDAGAVRCGSVIVTADAWTNTLLSPIDHQLPLVVLREQVSYFPTADLAPFARDRFPVWIWMDDPCYYGFPVYGDTSAVKAAEDCGGSEVDANTRTFDPDPDMESRLGAFMRGLVGDRFGQSALDDVPVHDDVRPRLRRRPVAGHPPGGRRARCRARLQVRRLVRSHARRPGLRRCAGTGAGTVRLRSPVAPRADHPRGLAGMSGPA